MPSAGVAARRWDAEHVGQLHTHKQRGVVLVARMTREPLFPVEQRNVDGALDWLDEHWRVSRAYPMSSCLL